jgi:hypothetical protein
MAAALVSLKFAMELILKGQMGKPVMQDVPGPVTELV